MTTKLTNGKLVITPETDFERDILKDIGIYVNVRFHYDKHPELSHMEISKMSLWDYEFNGGR